MIWTEFLRMGRRGGLALALLLAVLWGLVGGASGAIAAEASAAAPAGEKISREEMKNLVSTLEDDQKRAAFLKTLKTAVAAQEKSEQANSVDGLASQLISGLSDTLGNAGSQLGSLGDLVNELPVIYQQTQQRLDTPGERETILYNFGKLAVVLTIGLVARLLAVWLTSPVRRRVEAAAIAANSRWERVFFLTIRFLIILIPPIVMAISAWVALPLVRAKGDLSVGITAFVSAVALLRGVLAMADAMFHPGDPSLRPVTISEETAEYLMIWMRRLAVVGIFGYFALTTGMMIGLPKDSHAILLKILGMVFTVMTIIFVMQNRQGVADWLRKGTHEPPEGYTRRLATQHIRQRLADVWHVLTSLYLGAVFMVWAAEIKGGFAFMLRATIASVMIVAVTTALMQVLHLVVQRAFSVSEENAARFPGLEKRVNRYVPILETALRIVLSVTSVLALAQAWGLDTIIWLGSDRGQRLTSGLVTIAVVLVAATALWEFVNAWMERYLGATDSEGRAIQRSARARTLLPLARSIMMVVLTVMVGLTILSEIGVNIAPLLAGAGVVGLAVGFGSQKLVQDVITGAFILFEDTVAVGDTVQVGPHTGVVEGLSIRTLRLRDSAGSVHTIPFSTVGSVVNMSKDFSYYVLNLDVSYDADTDQVGTVLREVAAELRQDPTYGASVLDGLDVLGVDQFAASSVVIRSRLKTLPGKQWWVGRELNRRIKKALDLNGIEIPYPHTTVVVSQPIETAVAGAAAATVTAEAAAAAVKKG